MRVRRRSAQFTPFVPVYFDQTMGQSGSNNMRLRAGSPAIDMGGTTSFTTDLGRQTANNGVPDIGAFEFIG